jgi:hypothetical protein
MTHRPLLSRRGDKNSGVGGLWGVHKSGPAHLSGNQLVAFLEATNKDPIKAMNLLQDAGIVSDNCVFAESVSNTGDAVRWLYDNWHRFY